MRALSVLIVAGFRVTSGSYREVRGGLVGLCGGCSFVGRMKDFNAGEG